MVASILTAPKVAFFDSNGSPLSGGKVYFYEPGGAFAVAKDTYSDYAAATANTNPVILDSRGEANIRLSGNYDVKVTTSAGVTVYTEEDVTGLTDSRNFNHSTGGAAGTVSSYLENIVIDLASRDCACDFDPSAGTGTDDTAALQAVLDSITVPTHTGEWYNSLSPGGIIIRVPGILKITSTVTFPGGVVFEGYEGVASGFYFAPSSADTLFSGNTSKYSRDATWTHVGFRNLGFFSTLFDSPYLQNVGIDFSNVQRWFVESCYFEGWGTGYKDGGASYYQHVSNTEHFNNLIHYDQGADAGPITFDGGVMWNYETDWASNPVKPSQLCKIRKAAHFSGTSLEPRTAVEDADTFVCIDAIGDAGVTGDVYSESAYPLIGVDYNNKYSGSNLRNMKDGARTLVRFRNFDLGAETITYNNQWSAPVKTSWSGGILQKKLLKNPDFRYGSYGWTLGSDAAYSTSTKFLSPTGIIDINYSSTSQATNVSQTIAAADIARYAGRRIFVGMLAKPTDMTEVRLQAQDDPFVTYKYADLPCIEYDNGWKLYVTTYDVQSGIGDLSIKDNSTPANATTSRLQVAGFFIWINGIDEIPLYDDLPPAIVYTSETTASNFVGYGDYSIIHEESGFDPTSLTDGSIYQVSVYNVYGAKQHDHVFATTGALSGCTIDAYMVADAQAVVTVTNNTGATVDIPSSTLWLLAQPSQP